MLQKHSEDLFADSTMTFGEHLEELRTCLFKALIGLGIGFAFGMLVGKYVVGFIQTPLTNALEEYYEGVELKEIDRLVAANEGAAGQRIEELRPLVSEEHLVYEPYLIELSEVASQLRNADPNAEDLPPMPENPPGHPPSRYGPTQVLPSDLTKPAAIVAALMKGKTAKDGPYQRIWQALGAADQNELVSLSKVKQWTDEQRAALAILLNHVVDDASLYDPSAFRKLKLRPQGRDLASRHDSLPSAESRRLNRLLLEAALPGELAATYPDMISLRLWRPVDRIEQVRPDSLSAHEPFLIYIKASLVTGIVVSSPWVFWQIWSFVAAGLYPHERRYVHVFLPFSLGLFLAGAAMAFFFVFEPVLRFLFSFNWWLGIDPRPRISEWLNFVLFLPLGFGISFQLPLVMLFLERIGIFDVSVYKEKWRVSVLVIFVVSMILTPSDPTSMLLMAIPLCVLYVGGVYLCQYMPRIESPLEAN